MSKEQITATFKQLAATDNKAFIAYIMAGDGGLDQLKNQIQTLEEAGVDIIELGIPFSDPAADGPTIQEAGLRALANGVTLPAILKELSVFKDDVKVPIVLMGYLNPLAAMGFEKFAEQAKTAGVAGVILPDVPYEEEHEIKDILTAHDLPLIRLVTLTSDEERIRQLTADAEGFIYAVTVNGTTGARADKNQFPTELADHLERIKTISPIPVCAGFGISSKEAAKNMNQHVDGVIVGSQIVQYLHEEKNELIKALIPDKNGVIMN